MVKKRKFEPVPAAKAGPREVTGLYWPCQTNLIEGGHGDIGPVACPIKVDIKGRCYYGCSLCKEQHFFSATKWSKAHGYTAEDARRLGYTIIV